MEALYFIGLIPAILSFLGCSYTILTVLFFKELHTFLFRLLLYLATSNLITSVSIMLPNSQAGIICSIQGFLISLGSLSSLLWTACIMYAIYKLIVKEEKFTIKTEIVINGIIWPSTVAVAGIGIPYYTTGHEKGWCWYDGEISIEISTFYGPYCVILVFNLVICVIIKNFLAKSLDSHEVLKLKNAAIKKFMFYPLILILCYVPVFIHRFFQNNLDKSLQESLNILAIIGVSITGFACFILYAMTRFVRSTVSQYFSPKIHGRDISLLSAEEMIKD